MHNLPGEWYPDMSQLQVSDRGGTSMMRFSPINDGKIVYAWGALTDGECDSLSNHFLDQRMQAVSVSGFVTGSHEVGSMRATAWSPELADIFWKRWDNIIRGFFPERIMSDFSPTDWYAMPATGCNPERREHRYWKPVGISPVLRFMKYEQGGEHNTHYDMGYDYEGRDPNDHRRTLMSFVLYLTTCEEGTGGCTRFIEDGQADILTVQRNHEDWTERARHDQVLESSHPVKGKLMIFDHRMAHDVEPYTGSTPRIIIRGDVIFEAVDIEVSIS